MTVRSDFSVNFEQSPRVIDITSASLEVSVQDSHDTLSDIQDSPEGGQYEFLVSTTGGEDLGGGTSVGLTTVLNDAQYAFPPTNPRSVGTITSSSIGSLIDSGATFQTDLVKRGDWVINFTDLSVTEVLAVVSEAELLTRGLRNGGLNTFTIADQYKVWEVQEAELAGGNFTAVDDGLLDIAPIFPVFGRTFRLTASSSATSTSQAALESGLFNAEVVLGVTQGVAGTDAIGGVPIGTRQLQSNNVADTKAIATARGLNRVKVTENLTVSTEDLSSGFSFVGDSPFILVTLGTAANISNCSLENLSVIGELDGLNVLTRCSLQAITKVSGFVEKCAFTSTVDLVGSIYIYECYSQVEGLGFFEIRPLTHNIVMRDFHGSVKIKNMTGGTHSIEINGGRLVIDTSTCTGGTIYARGKPFEVVGADGAGTTVVEQFDAGLSTQQDAMLAAINDEVQFIERWIHIDTEQITNGIGTQKSPFNNLNDTLTYMEANNLLRLHTVSDLTIDRNLKNFVVVGIGNPTIDFNGQNLDGSEFYNSTLKGTMTGVITVDHCDLFHNVQVSGRVRRSAFLGTVEQIGSTSYSGCFSGVTGLGYSQLKITAGNAGVRGFIGSLGAIGVTAGDHSIGISSDGRLLADATCIGGAIHVRGFPFDIIDNSGVGCDVTDETESAKVTALPVSNMKELLGTESFP